MESEAERDRRRRDRKSLRKTNGAVADDDESCLSSGCVLGSWRVGAKIGEGTFSRIYAATPVDPAAAVHGPVVLKVNKSSPDEPAAAAAAAAAAATPSTPAPKSDASFAHEAQVFRAVCEAEERSAGHRMPGTKLHLAVPRMYEHKAHAFAQLPPSIGSAQWTPSADAVEYMVLELCGVDLSKLRYDWQSRGQQPAAALHLIDLCLTALERFHKVGFVHRDIKPSNFLTCANTLDAAQRVMITDFGLSRRTGGAAAAAAASSSSAAAAGSPVTPPSATSDADNKFVGKSLYASFAAHRQEVQTPRDDVFSLLFVLLDLMYGDLPWKEMSKERADISKQRRWEDVLAMKLRLLGPTVCEQAALALAHPGDANFPAPDATWLRDYSLPPLIRRIFYQLHSMPAGAPVDYASIHLQLRQLQTDVQQQMQGQITLDQILAQYAKTAEKEAEQERKRQQDEADERARLAHQQKLLLQKQEEERVKERALAEYRAQHEARNAQVKANAAAAQQLAEQVAAARAQEEARLKSIAAAEQQRLQRERESLAKDAYRKKQAEGDAADTKSRRPTQFHTWSKRLRALFSDVLGFPRTNLNVINDATWVETSAEPAVTAPSVYSLESLWKQVDWAEAAACATAAKPLLGVKFVVWGGDWYRLTKPPESKVNALNAAAGAGPKALDSRSLVMESLSLEQLAGLKAYCDASSTLPKLDRSRLQDESYWKEKDPLRIIAVTIASLYDLAQQAIKGQIRISGFVPVVDKPKVTPTLAGTSISSSTSLKKILTKNKGDAETEAARAAAKAAVSGRGSPSPPPIDTLKLKSQQQPQQSKVVKVKSEGKPAQPTKDRKSIALDDSDSSSDSSSDDGSGDDLLVPASMSAAASKPMVKKPAAAAGAAPSSKGEKAAKRAATEERRRLKAEKRAAKEPKKATKEKEKAKKRLSRAKDDDEDMSAEDDEAEEKKAAARGDSDEDDEDAGSGDEVGRLVTKSKRQLEIEAMPAAAIRHALAACLATFAPAQSEFAPPEDFLKSAKPRRQSASGATFDIVPTYPNDPSVNLSHEYANINAEEEAAVSHPAKKSRPKKSIHADDDASKDDDASSMAESSVAHSVAKTPKALTEAQKKAAAKEAALASGPPRWTRRSARNTTLPADTLDLVIVLDPKKVRSHPDPMADSAKHDEVEEHATTTAAAAAAVAEPTDSAATPTKKPAAAATVAASTAAPASADAPLSVSTSEPSATAAAAPATAPTAAASIPSIVVPPSTPTAAASAAASTPSPLASSKSRSRGGKRGAAAAASVSPAGEAAATPSDMTDVSDAKPPTSANSEAASKATETAAAAAPPSPPAALTGRKRKGSAAESATVAAEAPNTPSEKPDKKPKTKAKSKKKNDDNLKV